MERMVSFGAQGCRKHSLCNWQKRERFLQYQLPRLAIVTLYIIMASDHPDRFCGGGSGGSVLPEDADDSLWHLLGTVGVEKRRGGVMRQNPKRN